MNPSTLYSTGEVCIQEGCYTFTIFDSFGDGLFYPGHYEAFLNCNPEADFQGAEFEKCKIYNFCCDNGICSVLGSSECPSSPDNPVSCFLDNIMDTFFFW